MALITCKKCGCKFSGQTKHCPFCGATYRNKNFKGIFIAVFLVFVFTGIIVGIYAPQNIPKQEAPKQEAPKQEAPKQEAPKQECIDPVLAFVQTNQFVENRLKAPSTASFPYYSDPGVFVRVTGKAGKCSYYIDSYVDSQNSFGAMIRTRFHAELQSNTSTDMWKLARLRFIE